MLEAAKHEASCFLTLTYDAQHLPEGGTVVPRDVQLFLKRFRKLIEPQKVRYFFVGEYGDESNRPHYHAAVFGVHEGYSAHMREAWGKGHIYVGDLTWHSAQYIAGYVTKKMTSKDDKRLNGRHPEFARMSLRPGIGADAMDDMAKQLDNDFGYRYIALNGDVPTSIIMDGKSRILGRYLSRKLRDKIGFVETGGQKDVIYAKEKEMLDLFKDWLLLPQNSSKGFEQFIHEKDAQAILNFDTKQAIYSQGKLKKL